MKREIAELITEACKVSELDAEVYEDYKENSFTEKTTAVSVSQGSPIQYTQKELIGRVISAIISNADMFVDESLDYPEPLFGHDFLKESLKHNSLGQGIIIY